MFLRDSDYRMKKIEELERCKVKLLETISSTEESNDTEEQMDVEAINYQAEQKAKLKAIDEAIATQHLMWLDFKEDVIYVLAQALLACQVEYSFPNGPSCSQGTLSIIIGCLQGRVMNERNVEEDDDQDSDDNIIKKMVIDNNSNNVVNGDGSASNTTNGNSGVYSFSAKKQLNQMCETTKSILLWVDNLWKLKKSDSLQTTEPVRFTASKLKGCLEINVKNNVMISSV